ncbi:MAG TPA: helicase C-terminal domain-containing protein, partial [Terriglobales bacterium]|nr:helicase C-terminal domain-containing protein [Terriglobales bacterium]
EADVAIASALGNNGVGSYIVDNDASRVYALVEPLRPAISKPLGRDTVALLEPGGAVAARLEGYEHRPQQLRMLDSVAAAFNEDAVLTVEAGTGTGKSLAYLLPAIQWSLDNKERVIVSTHTINLQEQLIAKDLPFLIAKAGLKCTTALVKGRGNYLCQRKAAQLEQQGKMLIEDDLQRELTEVLAWAKRSKDGSLSDLPVRPRPEVWEQVISENDNCLRSRCPHYDTCFFYSARRSAAKADIVVVNHHLLMADLALRHELGSYSQNAILPPAPRMILDEAHHLEDVATSYFGLRLSLAAIERIFSRLRSPRAGERGVLPVLEMALDSVQSPDERVVAAAAARRVEEHFIPRRLSLMADAEQTFLELTVQVAKTLGREVPLNASEKLRVGPALRRQPFWGQLDNGLRRLAVAFGDYADELERLSERLDAIVDRVDKQVLYLLTELGALRGRLAAISSGLLEFLGTDDDVTCRWLELRHRARGGLTLGLHGAPIRVGPLLRKALFDAFPTTVMTSATLAVSQRFDYFHERVGASEIDKPERRRSLLIDSPFDFEQQAVLAVPRDIPEPTDAKFEISLRDSLRAILAASGGGTFVLFTAYGLLNRMVTQLEPELRAAGFSVLKQGQSNRQWLLQRFVQQPKAVLFATDSFWEGVDVRGDALRCVVITRLPFRVPTKPIEQARVEELQRRGGDPFSDHALPQAVIKLKQGFGRLIRSRTDRGAVVLLDSRVVRKAYGRVFLASLPPARRLIAPATEVYSELQKFFLPQL